MSAPHPLNQAVIAQELTHRWLFFFKFRDAAGQERLLPDEHNGVLFALEKARGPARYPDGSANPFPTDFAWSSFAALVLAREGDQRMKLARLLDGKSAARQMERLSNQPGRTTSPAPVRPASSRNAGGAVSLADLNAASSGLYDRLLAPLQTSLEGADTLFAAVISGAKKAPPEAPTRAP